jgi:hypothetical protein
MLRPRQLAATRPHQGTSGAADVVFGSFSATEEAASGLGDLTNGEVAQIQGVVDEAGRPLEVAGLAARGARRGVGTALPIGKGPGTQSDIDYLIPPGSTFYYRGLEG